MSLDDGVVLVPAASENVTVVPAVAENVAVLPPTTENLPCLSAAAELSAEDALNGKEADLISLGKSSP
jgi:hypothetical protein